VFSSFEVIPAVDMQDGQVVQLVGGERGTGTTYGDPVESAERWVEAGAETLHLVDLDGAFEGERQNAAAVESIVQAVDVDVQLGGGIRTAGDAVGLLETGLDRVILGTAAVETPEIVGEISETHPGTVMVSLDAKGGEVVVSGWTEGTGLDPAEAAARYEAEGAGAILFTDVDVEGQLEGIRREPVERVVERSNPGRRQRRRLDARGRPDASGGRRVGRRRRHGAVRGPVHPRGRDGRLRRQQPFKFLSCHPIECVPELRVVVVEVVAQEDESNDGRDGEDGPADRAEPFRAQLPDSPGETEES